MNDQTSLIQPEQIEQAILLILADDIGETTNLAAAHPDRVKEMTELLQRVRENGRSRP